MAKTSNHNTCAPAAIIPARARRRRLVNAKPSGSPPDQYVRPTLFASLFIALAIDTTLAQGPFGVGTATPIRLAARPGGCSPSKPNIIARSAP